MHAVTIAETSARGTIEMNLWEAAVYHSCRSFQTKPAKAPPVAEEAPSSCYNSNRELAGHETFVPAGQFVDERRRRGFNLSERVACLGIPQSAVGAGFAIP
ncbi:MAG: hypothetical protein AB1714_15325 [Acidobacteriota bacterium]